MRVAISLALVLAACATPGDQILPFPENVPIPVQTPNAPPVSAAREGSAPEGGHIERDGVLADTFTAEGQTVAYTFDCRVDEVSLFELESWGLSRGWASTAGVRILDEDGQALVEVERSGGALYGLVLPFQAPHAGTYTYELTASTEWFRYTLVRNSSLLPPSPLRWHLGAVEEAHGYLDASDSDNGAHFALSLTKGESALVRVAPFREGARNDQAKARRARLNAILKDGLTGFPNLDEALVGQRQRKRERGGNPSFPLFSLSAPGPNVAQTLLMRAGSSGSVQIDVVALDESEPGIYVVQVERNPDLVTVAGRVGDGDDDPIAGVRVQLLLEPMLSPLTEVETNAEGAFATEVPAGDYTFLVSGAGATQEVRARVVANAEDRAEINLIYATEP